MSWGEVRLRTKLEDCLSVFPDDAEDPCHLDVAAPNDVLIQRARDAFFGLDPDVECCFHGSRILIHNPEPNNGLEGRAKHLSHGLDNRTGAKYLHIEKCRWLPTIPKTLANAAAIFDDPRDQSILFARSYGMHGIHLVVVRLNASGLKTGEISGQLITHFKHKHGDRQDVLRMRWKRQK
jgi:hypothetical protein